MCASHATKDALLTGVSAVPQPDLAGLFGDRIASRNAGLPQPVVAAAAEAYVALHERLSGCASHLGGGRSGAMWRDLTAAERGLTLEWLFYLKDLPMAEPHEAVRAVVALLAFEPRPATGSLAERIPALDREAGSLHALLTAALAGDGRIDDGERAQLARVLDRVDALSRDARALLNGGAR